MGKLRIGYQETGLVKEGGSIMLDLATGYIVKRYNVLPAIADMEGIVFETPFKLFSHHIDCEEVAEDLKEYFETMRKILRMRFEDGWIKLPLPIIECE